MITRRSLVAAALVAPFSAHAQKAPPNLIRIIIPTAAGGALDTIARLLAPQLREKLGATIIVENKPGASSSIGAGFVAKAPPDGSTWLFTADSFIISPLVLSNAGYDVQKDFEPVTMVARGPMVLCAHPSRPYKTFADLVAAAKNKPDSITCATTGIGGMGHLTGAALTQRVGIRLVYVPFRGGGPAVIDAVAGHVDTIVSSAATLAPQIEAGQLRPLVQCGEKRAPFLPDVPTARESGATDFESSSWYAFFAPAGTPGPIVRHFHDSVVSILGDAKTRDDIATKFRVDIPLLDPAALRALIARQLPEWAAVIRENNIKAGG